MHNKTLVFSHPFFLCLTWFRFPRKFVLRCQSLSYNQTFNQLLPISIYPFLSFFFFSFSCFNLFCFPCLAQSVLVFRTNHVTFKSWYRTHTSEIEAHHRWGTIYIEFTSDSVQCWNCKSLRYHNTRTSLKNSIPYLLFCMHDKYFRDTYDLYERCLLEAYTV